MGIYNDGKIYGISWEIYDKDESMVKNWEYKSAASLTVADIAKIQTEFNLLTPEEREYARIYRMTQCSDTYGNDFSTYSSWGSIKEYQLLELFTCSNSLELDEWVRKNIDPF